MNPTDASTYDGPAIVCIAALYKYLRLIILEAVIERERVAENAHRPRGVRCADGEQTRFSRLRLEFSRDQRRFIILLPIEVPALASRHLIL